MATRPRYQNRAAVAAKLGISSDRLAHEMRRHPEGMPEPDDYVEEAGGKVAPIWLRGRDAEWRAWRATFPGRTGRPRKDASGQQLPPPGEREDQNELPVSTEPPDGPR